MARDRVIALENSGRGAVSGLASQGKRIGDTESSQIALSQRVENLQWEIRNLQSDRRYDREKIAKLESEIVALTQKAIAWGAGGAVVMLILASTGAIPKFFEAVTGVIEKPSIPVQAEDKVSSPWRGE
jgi:predicted RNase H-like nuclease (RuvC/YqgF family)